MERGTSYSSPAAKERVLEFDKFYRLLNGDTYDLKLKVEDQNVFSNYFESTAVITADLLMAFPPVIEGASEDVDVNDALHDLVINLVTFGTGVLYPNEMGIDSIDPRMWFPYPRGMGDAIVGTHVDVSDDGIVEPTTTTTVLKLGVDDSEMLVFKSVGDRLTDLIAQSDLDSTGERQVVSVARRPATITGEWGRSVFADMIDAVTEVTKRYSNISSILSDHSNPIMVAKRKEGVAPPVNDYDTSRSGADKLTLERAALKGFREQPFAVLSGAYEGVEYLTWDGKLDAAFAQIDHVEDLLFSITGVPAALHGVLRGKYPPSGIALKRLYANSYVMLETLQHQILNKLRKALALAGIEYTDIIWKNPLDILDKIEVDQQAGNQQEQDIRDGRETNGETADSMEEG